MKPDEYIEDKPKNHFEWGYLYKVYLVILIAVFLLALANQAHAGVFLEINGNMDYYESQMPLSSITQNSDTWDAVAGYMNDVHGVPFPTYSQAQDMDDLLENVLMFYVGQYCNLSGTAAQQVYDTCTDIADTASQVWDYISLDLESGDFIATPNHSGDLSNVIHGVVDPLIYDTPSGGQIGNWYPLPVTVSISNQSASQRQYFVSDSDVYMCCIGKSGSGDWTICDLAFAIKGSDTATYTFYGSTTAVSTPYSGTVSSGFYSARYGQYFRDIGIAPTSWTPYSSLSDALTDFFGTEVHTEPYLNGEGYIINENPTYAPLSGFSALNYPYRTKIVDNHTNTTDPYDPVGYPEGVNTVEPNTKYTDIPTWLVDPTVDIPEEPDYLQNVDVELPDIEPDTGFITDVYNALPSGIVSMIAVGLGLGVVMKIIS